MISVRYTHPVTRRRCRVMCADATEAAAVRERVRYVRVALKSARMGAEQACRELATRRASLTLAEATRGWVEHTSRNNQTNVRRYLATSLSTLANEPLEALDRGRLARWIKHLTPRYADSSILANWRIVSAIVRSAIERHKIDFVPWGDWRPPRRLDPTPRPREVVTDPADVARILAAARELDAESRAYVPELEPLVALALLAGLRNGELSGLRWSDVDAERRRVTIARQYDGEQVKTTAATIRAPAELFEILERHRARLEVAQIYAPDGPVFPQREASRRARKPLHRPGIAIASSDLRPVIVRAGLRNPERWTVHSLRASFVCLELVSSGSLGHAMARSRHRTLRAVQHYARGLLELDPPEPSWTLPPSPPRPPELS